MIKLKRCDEKVSNIKKERPCMLEYVTINQFKSIKSPITLQFEATMDQNYLDTLIESQVMDARYLKMLFLIGPNACGKSHLLEAYQSFIQLLRLGTYPSSLSNMTFKSFLPKGSSGGLSTFEIGFQLNQQRYRYRLVLNDLNVEEEELSVWPKGRIKCLFKRTKTQTFKFGAQTPLHWKELAQICLSNQPFLSCLKQWQDEETKEVYQFLVEGVQVNLDPSRTFQSNFEQLRGDKALQRVVNHVFTQFFPEVNHLTFTEQTIELVRIFPNGQEFSMALEEDSGGIQTFMFFLVHLMVHRQRPTVFFLDQFGFNLHTILMDRLIRWLIHEFNWGDVTIQFVLISQRTHLMKPSLFRRDQILIMDKDQQNLPFIKNLMELDVRKNASWEKLYLSGALAGIPHIDLYSI